MSMERIKPVSATIPRARRASRADMPWREGLPTPGASLGSSASRSKLTWRPAVPFEAIAIASCITAAMPRRSISRMR
ncbi:hypothetical protein D3C86_1791680 [compost metagenome]